MNVTRHNFVSTLPLIQETIAEADFFAIDGEFTGISNLKSGEQDHCYDTLEERYHKIQKGSKDFLLLQFGLSAFKYIEASDEYSAKTFNFYLFPVPFSRQAPDCRFVCQASSIDFLVSNGFDFNKVFKDGIPYLSVEDEEKMREKLRLRHDQMSTSSSSPAFTSPAAGGAAASGEAVVKSPAVIPDDQKEFVATTLEKIEEFVKSDEDSINLPSCGAFQRKLIYQTALLRFHSKIFLETFTTGANKKDRYIRVSRIAGEVERAKKELSRRETEYNELDDAIGFTKVIKLLSKSGKLIVGHNMYLDLIHVIHQFYTSLPDNYDDFKSVTQCLFAEVCDTKLMASMHPFREQIPITALGDLHRHLDSNPKHYKKIKLVRNSDDTGYDSTNEQLHEAGYDAFVTGQCFIRLANHLGTYQTPPKVHIPPKSALLKPFINKIFVMRIADIPYMNLAGKDLEPRRDNVFHVKIDDQSKVWSVGDVRQLFGLTGVTSIGWVDDTSLFVGVPHEHTDLITTLRHKPSYTITPYHVYKSNGQPKARKRSFEEMDCHLPKSQLNINAVPFISRRSISPIPEEKSFSENQEDLGEVVKRPKLDITDKATERSGAKANGDQKDKDTEVKDIVFDVPEEW